MLNCEKCNKEHDGSFGSGRFCSKYCSRSFSTSLKRKEINEKVRGKLKGRPVSIVTRSKISESLRSKGPRGPNKKRIKNEEVFIRESSFTTQLVKRRIVEQNLIKYQCAICNNDATHNNKPLTLQLDHINGNNRDHRLKNLRFLCPNCHTQTETYGGKKTTYLKNASIV